MTTATRNGSFPHDARSAAELYLAKGLAPIPLPPRSKDPGYSDWQRLRLTADTLDQHFPPGGARNVGVLNGAPSGKVLDVDVDCPEALAVSALLLPPTGCAFGRRSAPRSHRLYRADQSLDAAQEKYTDLDGSVLIELRGTGGLTVFPPSTHKETGEIIEWDCFGDPADVTLDDLRRAVGEVAAVALLARHWTGKGTRQDAFLGLAGGLSRAGWGEERVGRLVEALALATGDEEPGKRAQVVVPTAAKLGEGKKVTGWPRLGRLLGPHGGEVVSRVREWLGLAVQVTFGAAGPGRKVRVQAPYRPFPVEALPAPLGQFVREGGLALGCDPAYLALPVLAVAAGAIGNTRALRLKRGWEEPSVVWAALVGDSGTLKSPAYLKAVAHLFRLQKRLLLGHKQQAAEYQSRKQEHEAAKRAARKDGTDPGEPPEPPLLQRVVVSDTTVEKLAEILEDNPRGTLVARDELAGWLGSFSRYKAKGAGSDLPNWLEMHRAGTVVVDRKTSERKTLFVHRAAVSVTGGIQPGVLARALTPELLDAGLAARLLMAMPPKLAKRWSDAEVSALVEQEYQQTVDRLLALDFDTAGGERAPHVLTLSPGARTAWVEFYNGWAAEQAAAEGELAAAFSKLEGYAARLALIHHVVGKAARGEGDLVPVERESVEAGAALCRWFAAEARRIYATLSEPTEGREVRRLFEFIQSRGGTMTARGLMRANCRRYPDAESAEAALAGLVEAGAARWVDAETSMRGGKPIRAVALCMTHDTDDTEPLEGDDNDPGPPVAAHDSGHHGTDAARPVSVDEAASDGMIPASSGGVIGVMRHADRGDRPGKFAADEGTCAVPGGPAGTAVMRPTFVVRAVEALPNHRLVQDRAGLDLVTSALENTAIVALDIETTGLDARADRVRLLAVATDTIDGGAFTYLVDCFAVDPAPLWPALADKKVVLHNAAFDLAFMARMGFSPLGEVYDTMLLAHLLTAGTGERISLAACCQRWLGRDLDKSGQKADWSGRLSAGQLRYAALDAELLLPLLEALAGKVKEAGLEEAARIERRCLPAVVWMGGSGVAFDRDAWRAMARAAEEAARLREELDRAAPARPERALFPEPWNWDSTHQARQALALAGCAVENTAEDTLAALDHPLAGLLRRYRLARKQCSAFGADWLSHVAADGRVYATWRQVGTRAGRMSCSGPNLQQLPRGGHRGCVAAPPGRVLVKADYSQIELRIAAKVSGDEALLATYRRGDDLHTITARSVLGIAEVTRQHRQLAKALNFGLLYGMGARGFRQYAKTQFGVELTEAEAHRYRDAFFRSYPGLASWHRRVRAEKAMETRTRSGRRRLLDGKTPDTHRLNTPVQGTGADGLKLALALLWERRERAPGAFPVLAVHDEIVVECDERQAGPAADWLRRAMVDAMAPLIDPVPVEVEVKVARTWAGD